ncbi:Uncharacterized protein FWK35_00020495, partial [Aphis craccivora]
LLCSIGIKHRKQLTPKCLKLYKATNILLKKCRRAKSQKCLFKDRLKAAEKLNDNYLIDKCSNKINAATSLFLKLQVRETNKASRGRRFSIDEKMLSLSLYKRSPKCYGMLSKLFTLPSKRTLNTILLTVSIRPGICPLVMSVLKENVQKLKPIERYCSILFDEVCLNGGLQYNSTTDAINGFVDSGDCKSQLLADHALVFMIRGIKKKFKQPVSYTFCQGATKQHELVRQLREVICQVQATGLRVVATICDQGCANEGAINILKNETKLYYSKHQKDYQDDIYEIEIKSDDGVERIPIVYLFDVHHLLKCTRNNLMTKDLCFSSDGVERVAKWDHLRQLYDTDSLIADCKMLPRLTDNHVIPEKVSKMKVRFATQVFSQRKLIRFLFLAKNIIESKASDSAAAFLFFDKLFDSLNGSFDKQEDESLKILSTMKFIGKNGKAVKVPTLKNWSITIRGFQILSKILWNKGIKSLLPRHLNQDSLECFFGSVKSVGCSKPTCSLFISAYKTLLLNNLVSSHSPGANCEEFNEDSLMSYKNLFSFEQEHPKPIFTSLIFLEKQVVESTSTTKDLRDLTHTYIAGYIIRKLNKCVFKNCKTCLQQLCSDKALNEHALIEAREYQSLRPSLKYPAATFKYLVQDIISYTSKILPSICHHSQLRQTLVADILTKFNVDILHCSERETDFNKKIVKCIVELIINHWCTEVNRILTGKRKIRQHENDPIFLFANTWYLKHSKKRIVQGQYNLLP